MTHSSTHPILAGAITLLTILSWAVVLYLFVGCATMPAPITVEPERVIQP